MKGKEVQGFEGLVPGEVGFVRQKLCVRTRNTHVVQLEEKWRPG
jgi:hypothetical protein